MKTHGSQKMNLKKILTAPPQPQKKKKSITN